MIGIVEREMERVGLLSEDTGNVLEIEKARQAFFVAQNQFNWAEGTGVDVAIQKYNVALGKYMLLIREQ